MTPGGRYAAGLALVSVGALAASALVPTPAALGVRFALAFALVVQGPLGWWLVRSVGRPHFMPVWILGMLTRGVLLLAAGVAIVPLLGLPVGATLVSLAAILLALLLVEGATLLGHSEIEAR